MRWCDEVLHCQTGKRGFANERLLPSDVCFQSSNELTRRSGLGRGGIRRVQRRSNGIRTDVRQGELIGIFQRKGRFARTIRAAYDQQSR